MAFFLDNFIHVKKVFWLLSPWAPLPPPPQSLIILFLRTMPFYLVINHLLYLGHLCHQWMHSWRQWFSLYLPLSLNLLTATSLEVNGGSPLLTPSSTRVDCSWAHSCRSSTDISDCCGSGPILPGGLSQLLLPSVPMSFLLSSAVFPEPQKGCM